MKSSKLKLAVGIFLFLSIKSWAQDNSVGINTLNPNPNAVLHLVSTTGDQGLLIPQLTTVQRNAMSANLDATSTGLIIFDIDVKRFYFWNDTAWRPGLGLIGSSTVDGDVEGALPTLTIKDGVITNDMITDAIIASDKLAATGITAASYGTPNEVLQVTVNDAGQITAIDDIPITVSTG